MHPADARGTAPRHHGTTAPGLKCCIDYLTAKQPYLTHRITLAMGWPIATGVVEGTCRYLYHLQQEHQRTHTSR